MTTRTLSTSSKLYVKIFNHFRKQYKDINSLQTVYIKNKQVYAGDYTDKNGLICLASNTFDSDVIINFK